MAVGRGAAPVIDPAAGKVDPATGVLWRNADGRAALKKAFDALVAAGDKNLHYLAGDKLLGDDGEGKVDGSHPTDLGFARQADTFAEALAPKK